MDKKMQGGLLYLLLSFYLLQTLNAEKPKENLTRNFFNKTRLNTTTSTNSSISSYTTSTTTPLYLPCVNVIGLHENPTMSLGCKLCDIPLDDCTCEKQVYICDIVNFFTKPHIEKNSSTTPTPVYVTPPSLFLPIFEICVGGFSIFANSVVLIVFLRCYHQLSRCNKLIALLAFLDILFAFFMVFVAIPKLWTGKWIYGEWLCVLAPNMQDFSVALAVGVILIIAVERYLGIIYPYKHWLTTNRFISLLFTNFCLAIAMVTPAFIKSRLIDSQCTETFTEKQSEIYTWSLFVLYFILPCTVTFALYVRIIQHLDGLSKTSIFMIGSDKQKAKRLKDNQRIMRIIITILASFVLLTLPNKIYWIIKEYDDEILGPKSSERASTEKILKLFGFVPYALHITINPFIYSIIDRKFRRHVVRLFPACFSCCVVIGKSDSRSMTEPTFMTNDEDIEMKSVKR